MHTDSFHFIIYMKCNNLHFLGKKRKKIKRKKKNQVVLKDAGYKSTKI